MASELPKQTINIKDLSTKSVILYPSRAHITRDIHNVVLKPGINEVEIYGLAPTIDEHSVQIDGKGAATIVDMTVELVPNKEIFEEVYPEDSDEEMEDVDEEDPYEDSDDDPEAVRKYAQEIKELKSQSALHIEAQNSANLRFAALDIYIKSMKAEKNSPEQLTEIMEKYEKERGEIFAYHRRASDALREINKKIKRQEDKKQKAGKTARKEKQAIEKLKAKEKKKRELKKQERNKAARHLKDERLRYWPKKVYRVLLQLEVYSVGTPSSSRRGSFDSITLAHSQLDSSPMDTDSLKGSPSPSAISISLSLSYVTKEAAWTPRYDIKLSSVTKTASIVYRTEFVNYTSETWKDAIVSFSTSQTSYQGLDDVSPTLMTWRVRLNKGDNNNDSGLLSFQEATMPRRHGFQAATWFDRQQFFGMDHHYVAPQVKSSAFQQQRHGNNITPNFYSGHGPQQQMQQMPQMQQQRNNAPVNALGDYQMQLMLLEQQNKKRSLMARQDLVQGPSMAFGSAQPAPASVPAPQGYSSAIPPPPPGGGGADVLENFDFDSFLAGEVGFSESTWEDNGLTTTYEIPQPRTLPPSSQTRHHKIASLNATNVSLTYISVPKLRSAAFLRAKIRNPSSSVTLLKGTAGVTLDGSFLGNMALPRVSPSQTFDLPLGVDPSIQVSYPKPSVKRSTQGLFTKESAQVYTRNIWLTNNKSTAIDLLVLDQIPVSEEEKLRIDITSPRGLVKEGDTAKAGVSAREALANSTGTGAPSSSSAAMAASGNGAGKWGSAVAKYKKNGEISWSVSLERSAACLLKLEYEARLPNNDQIVSV